MAFILKKLFILFSLGIALSGLSLLMNGWLNALVLLIPIVGLLSTPFSVKTRHKELPILVLMLIVAGLLAWGMLKFQPVITEIVVYLHLMLSLLTWLINELVMTYFNSPSFVLTSPIDNFQTWSNALWLYTMLVFKLFLKYILVFVPEDSPLFLTHIAYTKQNDSWKVKQSWQFQRSILWFFIIFSLLLFAGYWQPFYAPYLSQWLTKDWLLYLPTLLIPIFIQWYLWLGGQPDIFQLPSFGEQPPGTSQALASFAELWERYQRTFSNVWRKAGNVMPGTAKDSGSIGNTLTEQLKNSLGLIIQTYPNPNVLSVIQKLVHDTLEQGKQVVVLSDYDSNSRVIHREWGVFFQYSSATKKMGSDAMMSVSLFIDKLGNKQLNDWVGKIGLILIPEGGQLFRRPYIWKLMAHAVRDHMAISDVTKLKSVVLAEPRDNFDTSIRNILTFYSTTNNSGRVWREYRVPMFPKNQFWWTIWGTDTRQDYIQGLSKNYIGSKISPAVPLAQFAGQYGPKGVHNWLIYDHSNPEVENAEMLQQSAGVERCQFTLEERSVWGLIPDLQSEPSMLTAELIVNGNPWRTLAAISQATSRPILCNVLIKRHLLSEYFIDNEQIFALINTCLLSPNFYDDSRQDASLQILRRIEIAGELPLSKLEDALIATRDREVAPDRNLFQQLYDLVESSLGKHFANKIQIHLAPHWYKGKNRLHFNKRAVLSLTSGNLLSAHLDWLLEYKILAEDDVLLNKVRKDHVQQLYWPEKVIAIEGKKYKVSSIDDRNFVIKVNHNEMVQTADYRCQKHLTLTTIHKTTTTKQETNTLGNQFTCQVVLGSYQVVSKKVVQSCSMWLKDDAKIITLPNLLSRSYNTKRMLRFKHQDADGNSLLSAGGALALSAWLNEAIISIMPEISPFFIALAEIPHNDRPTSIIVKTIIPQWSEHTGIDSNNGISLWIVEDSHTDMGIIQAIEENYWYLLNICYRWLDWYFSKPVSSDNLRSNQHVDSSTKNWFTYGLPESDEAIDLRALYEFLQLYDERLNAIVLQNQAEPVSFIANNNADRIICDFCANHLDQKKYYTLNDGRITCNTCQKIAVNDITPIVEYHEKLIRPFFRDQFNVTNFENVTIELVDQRTISAKQGEAFIPTAGFDNRAMGLAIYGSHSLSEYHDDSHIIYIESGFSLEETLSTLAHELCHIWQYMNLDIAKLNADSGDLLVEGHAIFVESHFVNTQLEKTHRGLKKKQFRRLAEKNTHRITVDDVYGRGYRQLLQRIGEEPPFDWLLDNFGKFR